MAELDMLAYGKSKGRPSKAMKGMKKYDKNFDANKRRMGIDNPNFKKSDIDKLIKSKVDAEVEARMKPYLKKGVVNKPTTEPMSGRAAGYGRITDTVLPDSGLKYGNESTGRKYRAKPPRTIPDPRLTEVNKYLYPSENYPAVRGDTSARARAGRIMDIPAESRVVSESTVQGPMKRLQAPRSSGEMVVRSSPIDNMVGKSRAGVPAERIPPVITEKVVTPPPIPTAAEQALATTASNLENAKSISALDKVKNLGKKMTGGGKGIVGGLLSGYGGYDIGSRLGTGAAGLFTDDETIKGIASTVGGLVGGAASMVPQLRIPLAVYGGIKGAADVYDMMREPSKATAQNEAASQQAAPKQPSMTDVLIADLLSGGNKSGGKSKSDDALATMLALANQGTAEANARAKRIRALDEAGMLDVDILK